MANYGDYMKARAKKDNDFFFGENNKRMVSNQYYLFNHILDEDTIIINTNNIKNIKGNWVLIVDKNKGIYLKDWQVRPAHNFDIGSDFYLVKLSRKFFKPYEFKFEFDDFCFEKEQDFDYLKDVAMAQNETKVANGFMG